LTSYINKLGTVKILRILKCLKDESVSFNFNMLLVAFFLEIKNSIQILPGGFFPINNSTPDETFNRRKINYF